MKKWEESKDLYLAKLLDTGLNAVPPSKQQFSSMTELEFMTWLKKQDLNANSLSNRKYVMNCFPTSTKSGTDCTKTLVLPLSLENNATITGTASVLEEFGKEFNIPCNHARVVLPYDERTKTFNINDARKHHEFLYLLQGHKKDMEQLVQQLSNIEKELTDGDGPAEVESEEEIGNEGEDETQCTTFQKIDGKFKKIYEKLSTKMWTARQSCDLAVTVELQQYMCTNRGFWENATDHHGCTVMHHAVQNGNYALVKTLLNAGVNPNVKENCGATPLTLAVLKGDEEMVQILLENFAICRESFYTSVPGPKAIAEKQNCDNIKALIEHYLAGEDELDLSVWEITGIDSPQLTVAAEDLSDEVPKAYSRDIKKCKTLLVGDQGTNKLIRSVKQKSQAAYEWAAEVPGDMHARGG